MGFSRQEYWSLLPFSSPGDLPNPGSKPGSPTRPANSLPSTPPLVNKIKWLHKSGTLSERIAALYKKRIQHNTFVSTVQIFVTPWTAAHQDSLSISNSESSLELMSIKSMMPSNHLILCQPLFLLPSIFPNIRVFSKESVLRIRWPTYWSFSFSISPSNEYSALISFSIDWFDLAVQWTLKNLL